MVCPRSAACVPCGNRGVGLWRLQYDDGFSEPPLAYGYLADGHLLGCDRVCLCTRVDTVPFFSFPCVEKMRKRRAPTLRLFKILGHIQQWTCRLCRNVLESTAQIDHVVPLWCGGSNDVSNLQILCVSCHARKTQEESEVLVTMRSRRSIEPRPRQGAPRSSPYFVFDAHFQRPVAVHVQRNRAPPRLWRLSCLDPLSGQMTNV